jgi:hypothetical protein
LEAERERLGHDELARPKRNGKKQHLARPLREARPARRLPARVTAFCDDPRRVRAAQETGRGRVRHGVGGASRGRSPVSLCLGRSNTNAVRGEAPESRDGPRDGPGFAHDRRVSVVARHPQAPQRVKARAGGARARPGVFGHGVVRQRRAEAFGGGQNKRRARRARARRRRRGRRLA